MSALEKLYLALESINHKLGRTIAWLAVVMVLVQFGVVVMRYIFGYGSIMLQESIVYLHSLLFMLGAGYTLLHEGHVRVDVFYREMNERRKAMVDFAGSVFLLIPVSVLIWWWSMPYVELSWSIFEGSKETSGIQAVFLLKSVILAFTALIALQGVAMALRNLLVLTGHHEPHASEDGAQI